MRHRSTAAGLTLVGALAFGAAPAAAYEPLVEKQRFTIENFQTQGGETVAEMTLGYETYGTLNEAKDNVILIPHFFSGTSHAAGRYTEDGPRGYWDYLIGSGKPINTDEYFVISVDTPVNLNANSPNVITTGPASTNPETGEPYGFDFPILTIRDFVETQKGLLDQLEIETLHAVMGASMGALQSYEWAAAYPDKVERLIAVIGSGWSDANLIAWLGVWAAPIRLDPNWNDGDYYGATPPTEGLTEALKIVTLHSQSHEWANGSFGRAWASEQADPAEAMDNLYQVETILHAAGAARAKIADANHFLYLVKANQLFVTGHGEGLYDGLLAIDAPTLMIHTEEDLIFFPDEVVETASIIRSDGTPVQRLEIEGTRGHLDGVIGLGALAEPIRAFLAD